MIELFDVALEFDDLTVSLLIHFVEFGDSILILVLKVNQFVEIFLSVCVTES